MTRDEARDYVEHSGARSDTITVYYQTRLAARERVSMQLNPDTIFEAAVQLPERARLELISRLMDTMPGPPGLLSLDDPNLLEELDRRAADDSGSIPWNELKNR